MRIIAYVIGCYLPLALGVMMWTVAAASAEGWVLVRAVAPLDEPRGLCLDIPGHRHRVNVRAPLVVHTCKWGIWNHDERFEAEAIARGELRMPDFNLCVGVAATQERAAVLLAPCDGRPVRKWVWSEGRLRLAAAPHMCLTIGPEQSELTPGGRRLPSRHVARSLMLAACRESDRDRQTWELAEPAR